MAGDDRLARSRAGDVVDDLLARAPHAIETARRETEGLSAEVLAVAQGQLARLTSGP